MMKRVWLGWVAAGAISLAGCGGGGGGGGGTNAISGTTGNALADTIIVNLALDMLLGNSNLTTTLTTGTVANPFASAGLSSATATISSTLANDGTVEEVEILTFESWDSDGSGAGVSNLAVRDSASSSRVFFLQEAEYFPATVVFEPFTIQSNGTSTPFLDSQGDGDLFALARISRPFAITRTFDNDAGGGASTTTLVAGTNLQDGTVTYTGTETLDVLFQFRLSGTSVSVVNAIGGAFGFTAISSVTTFPNAGIGVGTITTSIDGIPVMAFGAVIGTLTGTIGADVNDDLDTEIEILQVPFTAQGGFDDLDLTLSGDIGSDSVSVGAAPDLVQFSETLQDIDTGEIDVARAILTMFAHETKGQSGFANGAFLPNGSADPDVLFGASSVQREIVLFLFE